MISKLEEKAKMIFFTPTMSLTYLLAIFLDYFYFLALLVGIDYGKVVLSAFNEHVKL